jgi:hypothetical protein
MIVNDCTTYSDCTHQQFRATGSQQLGGNMVMVFCVFAVCSVLLCVQEVADSLGCPPLAHTLSTTYCNMDCTTCRY